jgi:hypothetical protein
MKAVRWATIAMLAAIGLTILGIKLGLLWRGALVPQMLVLVGGFSLIFSRAAYIIAALATWLPKRFRRTRKRRE